MLEVRVLGPDDWRLWRGMRLRALAEAPRAFGATLAEWQGENDSERRWRGRLSISGARDVLAFLDGEPVGMLSGMPAEQAGVIELISLWVAPSARAHGVGVRMIATIESWAVRQQARALMLSVREDNHAAIALYERCGFLCRPGATPAGDLPDITEVLFEKGLTGSAAASAPQSP